MKKTLLLFFVLILACSMLFSCGTEANSTNSENLGGNADNSQGAHTHTYESSWTITEQAHYKKCTCHPEATAQAAHFDYVDQDGRCDVCMYVLSLPQVYTVTVVDQNGLPVQNAEIKLSTTVYDKVVTTNEQGVASIEFVYHDSVKAIIFSLPENHTPSNDERIFYFDGTELTITVVNQTPAT